MRIILEEKTQLINLEAKTNHTFSFLFEFSKASFDMLEVEFFDELDKPTSL